MTVMPLDWQYWISFSCLRNGWHSVCKSISSSLGKSTCFLSCSQGVLHTKKDCQAKAKHCPLLAWLNQTPRAVSHDQQSTWWLTFKWDSVQSIELASKCLRSNSAGPLPFTKQNLPGKHWFVCQSRFVQEPFDLEVVEVGDPNVFHQPLVHQFLHGLS